MTKHRHKKMNRDHKFNSKSSADPQPRGKAGVGEAVQGEGLGVLLRAAPF